MMTSTKQRYTYTLEIEKKTQELKYPREREHQLYSKNLLKEGIQISYPALMMILSRVYGHVSDVTLSDVVLGDTE